MKVSLIIPMYNEQSIVDGAIDTFYNFLKDKYDDFELIFVSDGSTDGCDNAVALASIIFNGTAANIGTAVYYVLIGDFVVYYIFRWLTFLTGVSEGQ